MAKQAAKKVRRRAQGRAGKGHKPSARLPAIGDPPKKKQPKRAAPDSRVRGSERDKPARRGKSALPLSGIRVVEFTHMVMGPTCGMILGDLGAEVIKVEPPGGDKTRTLIGSGAGFFRVFNR